MNSKPNNQMIMNWLSLTNTQMKITNELENVLREKHQLSLKEFYVLLFLSDAPEKKLKLHQLQNIVGLSQSAMSRLVSRFEAKDCGVLKRQGCMEDRRAIYTSITPEGEAKVKRASVTVNEALEKAFSNSAIQQELRPFLDWFRS